MSMSDRNMLSDQSQKNDPKQRKSLSNMTTNRKMPIFNSYMSLCQVQEKLHKGEVIEGVLRINPKNYEDAFISAPEGGMDIYIGGVHDRNASLNGDRVAVELLPCDEWQILYDKLDAYLVNRKLPVLTDPLTAPSEQTRSEANSKCTQKQTSELSNVPCVNIIPEEHSRPNDVIQVISYPTKQDIVQATTAPKKSDTKIVPLEELSGCESSDYSECSNISEDYQPRTFPVPIQVTSENRLVEPCEPAKEVFINVPTLPGAAGDPEISTPELPDVSRAKKKRARKSNRKKTGEVAPSESGQEDKVKLPTDAEKTAEPSKAEVTGPKSAEAIQVEVPDNKTVEVTKTKVAKRKKKPAKVEAPQSTQRIEQVTKVEIPENILKMVKETKVELPTSTDARNQVETNVSKATQEIEKSISSVKTVHADLLQLAQSAAKQTNQNEILCSFNLIQDFAHLDEIKAEADTNPAYSHLKRKVYELEEENRRLVAKFQTLEKRNESMFLGNLQLQIDMNALRKEFRQLQLSAPLLQPILPTATQPKPKPKPQPKPQPIPQKPVDKETKCDIEPNCLSEKTQRIVAQINLKPTYMVKDIMQYPWWQSVVQRTARVVHILDKCHTRTAAGSLKLFKDKNPLFALFSPTDPRVPRMKIPFSGCPENFASKSREYSETIYLARIVQWSQPTFAIGELVKAVGDKGDLETEIEALLLEQGVDIGEFPTEIMDNLPSVPYSIPEEEIKKREDFRELCIISIDPASAKDLDDAVSCVQLTNGNFQVGVHIADVTHFLEADSLLDKVANRRASSYYLPETVIPMLPSRLCEDLCSLNPGTDRLSFSVLWEMDCKGKIKNTKFHKSVIRSCCKLSYGHAQIAIDSQPEELNSSNFPPIYGNHTLAQICAQVKTLNQIATCLRAARKESGCLRLQQVKMLFDFDEDRTASVNNFLPQDSNFLIEEFMLLANISVANKIFEAFPDRALLRGHPKPHELPLLSTLKLLKEFNIELDTSTSRTFMDSLISYEGTDDFTSARYQVLTTLCSRPMQLAVYLCTGVKTLVKDRHHYALNEPLYTHFTSPIRRYADVVVHRLLAAAVYPDRFSVPQWTETDVQMKASHCNARKLAARNIQESAADLYLGKFVHDTGGLVEQGMIMGVLDKAVDIYLLRLGIVKRAYVNNMPVHTTKFSGEKTKPVLTVIWRYDKENRLEQVQQSLSLFTRVSVILQPTPGSRIKYNLAIIRPDLQSQL